MSQSKVSIGITYRPNTTPSALFYSGLNQTALTLFEVFTALGWTVTLMDTTSGEETWFPDYPAVGPIKKLHETTNLDVLLDIDGLVSAYQRKKAAKKTIVFLRTFLQFAEMDATVYIETPMVLRTMEEVEEVWCWDILNPINTIPSIQTMFPCPIRRVPFVWSSSVAEHFSKGKTAQPPSLEHPAQWRVHVAEKNTNNTSSCVLPLVAIKELVQNNHFPNATYHVHNVDTVKENRFFKENIMQNIEPYLLPLVLEEKQPFWQWIQHNPILFSHSRFINVRTGLLNALWMGIPLVHNSDILKELHPVLKDMFYTGNDIKEMASAFSSFHKHSPKWYESVQEMRDTLINTFGIRNKLDKWAECINEDKSTKHVQRSLEVKQPQQVHVKASIIVGFSDMWPGFNTEQNFFTDALRHEYPQMNVTGLLYSGQPTFKADLLIVGPFSNEVPNEVPNDWKQVQGVPVVFFSAENWPVPSDLGAALYLTSSPIEDDTHLRIPTWLLFIDWFSNNTSLPEPSEDNPIRIPLHFATTSHPIPFEARQRFCGFVVSNPICAMRNEVFLTLNQYKPVSSGGALFNNIGGQLALKYPGGGGGDLSKHAFFSEHQFSLSFENSKAPGYVTEKVLHAKMAGCVPLYWGDANTADFAPHSFINVSAVDDPTTVVEIMKKLEANPAMCAKIAKTPILDETCKQKALTIIKNMCQKMMGLLHPEPFINHTFIVNLDTRRDRWESLLASEPYLNMVTQVIERIPAVNGLSLQMNHDMYELFKDNTFQWKKSIIGCALSHLSIWNLIAQEKDGLYMVLEDDVRFQKEWRHMLRIACQNIPVDADLLYLGGVLPPNKPALPSVLQSVNDHWAYIKPNTLFTPVPLPIFHFCTYSYLLTPAGAQKLVSFAHKINVPCDHFMGNPATGLHIYVSQPLLSFCFQEDNPIYAQAAFNNLHATTDFDSDIYNNTECFSNDELALFCAPKKEEIAKKVIYHMPTEDGSPYDIYEGVWLEDMMNVALQPVALVPETVIEQHSLFLVQRPHLQKYNHLFTQLNQRNMPFHILHLSDEFGQDDITFYSLPMCKSVIRNYLRDDLRDDLQPHIHVIPLGYHHKPTMTNKPWESRELMWSFHGTDWFERSKHLQPLSTFVPYSCHLQPDWNHVSATKPQHYMNHLSNSKFCPILRGNNDETFRLYEALEAGCLPVTTITNAMYLKWIDTHLGLSSLYQWTNPVATMQSNTITESLRQEVGKRWLNWKQQIQMLLR